MKLRLCREDTQGKIHYWDADTGEQVPAPAEPRYTPEQTCPACNKAWKKKMKAEQAFEMRAAFGPGEDVVNILTGKRYKT